MTMFVWLLAAFVASHILLAARPVRAKLVAALGEKGFQGLYSLISLALFGGAIWIYRGLAPEIIWVAPQWAWLPSSVLMLAASILFAGSLTPANKALAGVPQSAAPPSGVMRITRHPMMWSFAIWAFVHATLSGSLPTVILAIGIGVLALAGAAHQDGRKRRQMGETWVRYEAQTSFFPLGAQVAGWQPWSAIWPGPVPVILGVALWAVLTFLHPMLMGAPVVPPWGAMQ
jgi:uncharacterized membrane protein